MKNILVRNLHCRLESCESSFTLRCLSCMNEYMLPIGNGGYMCANTIRVLISQWLTISHINSGGA